MNLKKAKTVGLILAAVAAFAASAGTSCITDVIVVALARGTTLFFR